MQVREDTLRGLNAGTWLGLRAATLAQAGGGARDNVNREVPLFNSYHFFIK